jgi:hypothetical protein
MSEFDQNNFDKLVNIKKTDDIVSADLGNVPDKLKDIQEKIRQIKTELSKRNNSSESENQKRNIELMKELSLQFDTYRDLLQNESKTESEATKRLHDSIIQNSKDEVSKSDNEADSSEKIINANIKSITEHFENETNENEKALNKKCFTIGSGIDFEKYFQGALDKLVNSTKFLKDKFIDFSKWLYDKGVGALKTLGSWITRPFIGAWNLFKKYTSLLIGPTWNAIKYVATVAWKPIKWFIDVGFQAISFIAKGLKTIFEVGLKAIKKTVSILGFGFKTYFRWLGKLVMKTLTGGPLSLILGIPLVIMFVRLGLNAIVGLIETGGYLADLIGKGFGLLKNVTSWIWDGIKSFMSWIFDASGLSGVLDSVLEGFYNFIYSSMSTLFGEETTANIFSWISEFISYVSGGGSRMIQGVLDTASEIMDTVSHFIQNNWFVNAIDKLFKAIVGVADGFETIDVVGNFVGEWARITFQNLFGGIVSSLSNYMNSDRTSNIQANVMNRSLASTGLARLASSDRQELTRDMVAAMAVNYASSTTLTQDELIQNITEAITSDMKISSQNLITGNIRGGAVRDATQEEIEAYIEDIQARMQHISSRQTDVSEEILSDRMAANQQLVMTLSAISETGINDPDVLTMVEDTMSNISETHRQISESTRNARRRILAGRDTIESTALNYGEFVSSLSGLTLTAATVVNASDQFRGASFDFVTESLRTLSELQRNNVESSPSNINQEALDDILNSRFIRIPNRSGDTPRWRMWEGESATGDGFGGGRKRGMDVIRSDIESYIRYRNSIIEMIRSLDKSNSEYADRRRFLESLVVERRMQLYRSSGFNHEITQDITFNQTPTEFTGDYVWAFDEPDGVNIVADELARGAVVPFKDSNEYLALDKAGMEYIVEYTKSLPEWNDIRENLREYSRKRLEHNVYVNTTNRTVDSHELYTMKQLSKGIINA